jgi:hypothetical protein
LAFGYSAAGSLGYTRRGSIGSVSGSIQPMLPLAEVMDKMPPFNGVVSMTVVLSIAAALAAVWRPIFGPLIVLVAASVIPWFNPTFIALSESFEAHVGDAMRTENPAYFSFARSIPYWYLTGVLLGSAFWHLRRRGSLKREA